MSKVINSQTNSLQSYIDANRTKLDEALVSLRLMKEIDDFLEMNNVSQRELAKCLGYSEAYISQLMAGTKKFNISFLNNFENNFDVEVNFKIKCKAESSYFSKPSNSSIQISVHFHGAHSSNSVYSLENHYDEFFQCNDNFLKLISNERQEK